MINFIRFSILLVMIGLFTASYLTWEPLPQDGSSPGGSLPSNEMMNVLNGWAEKVPSLKSDIQELALTLKENLSTWSASASEKASLLSEFAWKSEQAETEETESSSLESLTSMLSQLKDQLSGTESDELRNKLQQVLDKAKTLPAEESGQNESSE